MTPDTKSRTLSNGTRVPPAKLGSTYTDSNPAYYTDTSPLVESVVSYTVDVPTPATSRSPTTDCNSFEHSITSEKAPDPDATIVSVAATPENAEAESVPSDHTEGTV